MNLPQFHIYWQKTQNFWIWDKQIAKVSTLLCQFPKTKFPVALQVWLDECLNTLRTVLQKRNSGPGEVAALQQTVSKPTLCPRAGYYLISQALQTQSWKVTQVKSSQGLAFLAFLAFSARWIAVQETHGELTVSNRLLKGLNELTYARC